jgi:peptidoglycan hydrolase CwlO-like protein
LNVKVTEVDNETQNNKKSLKLLDAEVKNIQEDVKSLFRLSSEFRKEMDELSEKVAELYVLKKIMAVGFFSLDFLVFFNTLM